MDSVIIKITMQQSRQQIIQQKITDLTSELHQLEQFRESLQALQAYELDSLNQ